MFMQEISIIIILICQILGLVMALPQKINCLCLSLKGKSRLIWETERIRRKKYSETDAYLYFLCDFLK